MYIPGAAEFLRRIADHIDSKTVRVDSLTYDRKMKCDYLPTEERVLELRYSIPFASLEDIAKP